MSPKASSFEVHGATEEYDEDNVAVPITVTVDYLSTAHVYLYVGGRSIMVPVDAARDMATFLLDEVGR